MEEEKNVGVYPWNSVVLTQIKELKAKDQIPHALALVSKQGWGEDQLLKLVCGHLIGFDKAFKVSEHATANLHWVAPEGAVIKVDQVRDAISFAYKTNQSEHYKVIAIAEAHSLNINAANALLKILEEPPSGTIIVLQTTRWGDLPVTLRSRLQRFSINFSVSETAKWLQQAGIKLTKNQLAEVGYSPLHGKNFETYSFSISLERLNHGNTAELIDNIIDADPVLWLSNWYRFILMRLCELPDGKLNRELKGLFDFCDELLFFRKQIATSNSANKRRLLERLMITWRAEELDLLSRPA